MKKTCCAWLALGFSGIGLLFWRWIWSAVYDPTTQLVHSNGLVELFAALMALFGLILLLLSRARLRRGPGLGQFGWPISVLRVCASLLSALAGARMLSDGVDGPVSLVLALLLLLHAAALMGLALPPRQTRRWQKSLILLPCCVSCYWLVAFYHAYGADPSYVTVLWPMLAGLLAAWGWLACAGRIYQPRKWDLALPLALLCVLLLGPSLTSPLSDGYRLSLASQLIWFWSVTLENAPAPIRKENSDA